MPFIGPTRREVLLAGAALTLGVARAHAADSEPMTAAVIGHTGHGDYGHGLDVVFNGVPGVKVVAVADPDGVGRANAAGRAGATRQ